MVIPPTKCLHYKGVKIDSEVLELGQLVTHFEGLELVGESLGVGAVVADRLKDTGAAEYLFEGGVVVPLGPLVSMALDDLFRQAR